MQFGGDEDPRCAAWFVDDERQLLYRHWPPLDEDSATDWQVIATGIVNRDEGVEPFVIDSTGRTLTVDFVVNPDIDDPARGHADVRGGTDGAQHVVRLPVEPVRGPSAGHVNEEIDEMLTSLHRHLRREDGVAMIVSLMVAFVVLMMSTIVVAQSIHSLDSSSYDRRRLLSVNAAESGTNHWYQYLQTTPIVGPRLQHEGRGHRHRSVGRDVRSGGDVLRRRRRHGHGLRDVLQHDLPELTR